MRDYEVIAGLAVDHTKETVQEKLRSDIFRLEAKIAAINALEEKLPVLVLQMNYIQFMDTFYS